jgi:N-acetylgalactosamine-N,N'-diacetylbacillosaminyl-diphospho-undecaprenol 4-alpha-N-acetylgalactosaminyltransferase
MKKKIAILINSIQGGGAERAAVQILNELKNDFDFHLVLLNDIIEYELPPGQKIMCFNQPGHQNIIIKFLTLPIYAYRYKKYCRKHQIEKSFSFLTRSHYINSLSKIFGSRSKIILSEQAHVSTYLKSLGKFNEAISRFLTKKLYSKADLIITNALLIKTDLQQEFNINTPFSVVHNPLNLTKIAQLSAEAVAEPYFHSFTFINIGSFRPQKNHALLIDAFNKIKHLNCKLLLLGKEGKNQLATYRKVKELHLEDRITFAGFDVNPFKFLSKANCFVLSSDFEGFPNVLQEALACKLPVISTDCKSGPREILAPGTDITRAITAEIEIAEFGILVPIRDVDLLAKAMALIYSDTTLQETFKEKGFERAKTFDIPHVISQFREILDS